MSNAHTPIIVSKESIAELVFPKEDVLSKSDEIKARHAELERATTLGNVEHNKIKIIFEDDKGELWFGMEDGKVYKFNGQTFERQF